MLKNTMHKNLGEIATHLREKFTDCSEAMKECMLVRPEYKLNFEDAMRKMDYDKEMFSSQVDDVVRNYNEIIDQIKTIEGQIETTTGKIDAYVGGLVLDALGDVVEELNAKKFELEKNFFVIEGMQRDFVKSYGVAVRDQIKAYILEANGEMDLDISYESINVILEAMQEGFSKYEIQAAAVVKMRISAVEKMRAFEKECEEECNQ